jgi:SmpA/OmlA family protein
MQNDLLAEWADVPNEQTDLGEPHPDWRVLRDRNRWLCAPQMASRVDAASIRAIKVGMTEREVRAILGEPRRVRPWGDNARFTTTRFQD